MKKDIDYTKPFLIKFPKIGGKQGFISLAEKENLPFEPKRIYWTYYTPEDIERGFHAHYKLKQILIAVAGTIIVSIQDNNEKRYEYKLTSPDVGVYIPEMCWRSMKYTHNAVQVCIASMEYSEKDYIRGYGLFLMTIKGAI